MRKKKVTKIREHIVRVINPTHEKGLQFVDMVR
jgi:hypothetical protein